MVQTDMYGLANFALKIEFCYSDLHLTHHMRYNQLTEDFFDPLSTTFNNKLQSLLLNIQVY